LLLAACTVLLLLLAAGCWVALYGLPVAWLPAACCTAQQRQRQKAKKKCAPFAFACLLPLRCVSQKQRDSQKQRKAKVERLPFAFGVSFAFGYSSWPNRPGAGSSKQGFMPSSSSQQYKASQQKAKGNAKAKGQKSKRCNRN
jgi:hypothetical protein